MDNETWLLQAGADIIAKKAAQGYASLTPLERLTYGLWLADYGMRNAGDLTPSADLHPSFMNDARSAAESLALPQSTAAFSFAPAELERRYFDVFDGMANEIRAVLSE